jgi:hypothetical protein
MDVIQFLKETEKIFNVWFIDIDNILNKEEFKNVPLYTDNEIEEQVKDALNYTFIKQE